MMDEKHDGKMNPNSSIAVPPSHHEAHCLSSYYPPGMLPPPAPVEWVRNMDGTPLLDHNGRPVSVNQILATKPLKTELCSRPGPGGKKLTYLSGEGVTRTLNEIFGYDGWNLDIKETKREECVKDDKDRFHVAYTARVRLTHRKSGAYKEDCGAGDSVDRSMGTAVAHAMKASVTDAMKRAARHFGDKLGNSLYDSGFSISKAPCTLQNALQVYEVERAKSKFGPQQNQLGEDSDIQSMLPPYVPSSTEAIPVSNAMQQQTSAQRQPYSAPNRVSCAGQQQNHVVSHPQLLEATTNVQQSANSFVATKPIVQQPPIGAKPMNSYNTKSVINTPHQNANKPTLPMITPINQPQCGIPPPPTPTEGLQSSCLFGLTSFSGGIYGASEYKENQVPQQDEFGDLEFDFDLPARPHTSTGRKSSDLYPPPMAGKRSGVPSPGTNKKSKPNPYL